MQVTTLLTKADEKPPEKPSAEAIADKQAGVDERAAELDQLRAVRAHVHELCCPAILLGGLKGAGHCWAQLTHEAAVHVPDRRDSDHFRAEASLGQRFCVPALGCIDSCS